MAGARTSLGKLLILLTAICLAVFAVFALFFGVSEQAAMRHRGMAEDEARQQRIRALELREQMLNQPLITQETVHIDLGEGGYRKPEPAREGGFDVEPTIARAASRLVSRLLDEATVIDRVDLGFATVQVRPESANSKADVDLALRMAALLRRRDVPAVQDFDQGGVGPILVVSDRELGDFGRVAEIRELTGGGAWAVVIDPEMRQAAVRVRDQNDELRFGFKTDHQTQAAYAREDAFEGLQRRLSDEVWRIGRDHLGIARDDEAEFRTIVANRFPEALLADLGQREFGLVRKVLEGPEGDDVFYQAVVSWAGDRRALRSVAESARGIMVARARLPFVRGGLALGALVLAFLGWLKVDWWLKGRHAFLSRVAFVILALLGVALSLQVSLHV